MQISLAVVRIELFFTSQLNPVFFPLKHSTSLQHETNSGQLTLMLSSFFCVCICQIDKSWVTCILLFYKLHHESISFGTMIHGKTSQSNSEAENTDRLFYEKMLALSENYEKEAT